MQWDGVWFISGTNGVDAVACAVSEPSMPLASAGVVPDALSRVSETGVPERVRAIAAIVRPVVVDARRPLESVDRYRDGCSGTPHVGAHPVSAGRVPKALA